MSSQSTGVYLRMKPLAGSLVTGLIASLCCGGSLIFAAVGLGALFHLLQPWRYIPEFLGAGAVLIILINWTYYRALARKGCGAVECGNLRRTMMISAALGLGAMVFSFLFLTWLNHAVINASRFMALPEYAQALIPGVPNRELLYGVMSLGALGLLALLPFPRQGQDGSRSSRKMM